MHSPTIYIPIYRKIAASCTTRLARSRSPITGAAHTIQRQHAQHPYTTFALETDIEGRCVSLQKARRKRRHDYPDAEVVTERGVPHSLRRRRNIVVALKLPRPESVDDRDRRKRRLDSESADEKETRLSSETLSK